MRFHVRTFRREKNKKKRSMERFTLNGKGENVKGKYTRRNNEQCRTFK